MKPIVSQANIIKSHFPSVDMENVSILMEGGSHINETTYNGDFVAKIKRKGTFRFSDGKLLRRVK